MLLDPYNQTDHAECKSRPDSGLSAITELDPGYITGMLLDTISHVAFFVSKMVLMICCFMISFFKFLLKFNFGVVVISDLPLWVFKY